MTASNCNQCGNWLVKNSNYCHMCAFPVSMTFESSTGNPMPQIANNGLSGSNWKDKAATTALLAMAMSAGSLFADFEPSFIALVPLGYLIWEPSSKLLLDLLGKLPDKPLASEVQTTLKLEYKTEDNRHWLLNEFPRGIDLSHLQHIAKVCLAPPVGEGASFSRRKVCSPGALSQGEFEALKDFFIETNFAFFKNSAAPNLGILLTERCTRLLRKSLNS